MRRYISCVVLILLCLVCAMIFYANASEIVPPSEEGENQESNTPPTGNGSDTDGGETSDEENEPVTVTPVIEEGGTILSEHFVDSSLRIEWTVYKPSNEDILYVSAELFLDTTEVLTGVGQGTLSINESQISFTPPATIGADTRLATHTFALAASEDTYVTVSATLNVSISNSSGVSLSSLVAEGIIFATENYMNMDSSCEIDMEHISQYPELPSGDEITSLAMVLNHLGYNIDKCELCDLYLEKGPQGFTNFYLKNAGNPRSSYNSFGCLAPVIVNTANRFFNINGGDYQAYDMSFYNLDALFYEVALGNPVIVWTCENFDLSPSVLRTWVVDGEILYPKTNMASMVLIGYNYDESTVTLANPAGTIFEIDMNLFSLRFNQMGAYAVVIK